MKTQDEYSFPPTPQMLNAALTIQFQLDPKPQVEFIAQPFAMFAGVNYFFRFTNPANGQHEDVGAFISTLFPGIAIGSLGHIGLRPATLPKVDVAPVVVPPDTGMPALKPGQVMGLIGPSGPAA